MSGVNEPSRSSNFRRKAQLYFALFKHLVTLSFQHKTELRDPQQVLRQKLGNDLEVLEFATDKLVKFGDNYNSSIVKATVQIKFEERIEKLNLVAKMMPQGELARKYMQCDVIMGKEIFFYEDVVPAYQKLGDIEITPKFYGARLTSDEGAAVDEGALLLMENLKESGYFMAERLNGLTIDHLKIAIPSIAKFHATGLALKQKDPEFYSKIKDNAKIIDLPPEFFSMLVSKLMKDMKNNRELSVYYERVKSLGKVDSNGKYTIFEQFDNENPYACLAHRDLWINNVMFHENEEGKIDGFKILDFQLYNISSPMTDLLYFLFTSLPRDFHDFDEAVKLYRESISDALGKLGCDASIFEEEAFERRLKEDAKIELYRCWIMANNIERRSVWDVIKTSPDAIQRIKSILSIYESKGWFDN